MIDRERQTRLQIGKKKHEWYRSDTGRGAGVGGDLLPQTNPSRQQRDKQKDGHAGKRTDGWTDRVTAASSGAPLKRLATDWLAPKY